MAEYLVAVGEEGGEALGVWNPTPPGIPRIASGLIICGIPITITGLVTATGRPDLILDPPTFLSLDFTLTFEAVTANAQHRWRVWLCNDPDPPLYSAAYLPSDQEPTAVLVEDREEPRHFAGDTITASLDLNDLFPIYRQSAWNGRFGVFFVYEEIGAPAAWIIFRGINAGIQGNPPLLDSSESPFVRGIHGHVEAQSRMDRCGRCGRWMPREQMLQDGWTRGLWVCEESWDPEDKPDWPIPPDVPPIND